MIASVGARILGSWRSSTRTSPGAYRTAPTMVTFLSAEPAAPPPPPGPHGQVVAQVVADPDDPDRGEGAQRSVWPQRGDLQFLGRLDRVELFGSPATHGVGGSPLEPTRPTT